jgi:hypothetical protein
LPGGDCFSGQSQIWARLAGSGLEDPRGVWRSNGWRLPGFSLRVRSRVVRWLYLEADPRCFRFTSGLCVCRRVIRIRCIRCPGGLVGSGPVAGIYGVSRVPACGGPAADGHASFGCRRTSQNGTSWEFGSLLPRHARYTTRWITSGCAVIQDQSTCPARGFWGTYSGWLCCRTSWRQKRQDGRYDK